MTRSRIDLNDLKLTELYNRFQRERRSLGEMYRGAYYCDFVDHGTYSGEAFPAVTTASEHIIAATNTVNRFCYDLHSLISWAEVFQTITEDEKFMALVEFVIPMTTQCLSAPYATKQMLIKSVCKISHQTNRFCTQNWTDSALKPDKKLDFNETTKLAQHFAAWPAMCSAFSLLNDEDFIMASDDYRNRFNHGFPRRIELGHTMIVERDPDSAAYRISNAPPLHIADLVPVLAKQYEAALNCHRAYIELIREQHKLWASLPRG
jgi:hypothetical protein